MDDFIDRESMGISSPPHDHTSAHPIPKSSSSSVSSVPISPNVSGKKSHVLNELLCFTRNNFHKDPTSSLCSTISSFSTESEVTSAKNILVTIKPNLECMKSRVGSNKKAREVSDIVEFFCGADRANKLSSFPIFVASDLSRIPSLTKEELYPVSIAQRLSSIESELARVKSITIANNTDISAIKSSNPSAAQVGTSCDNLSAFIKNAGHTVYGIQQTSRPEAKFDSFKVTVDRDLYSKFCGEDACDFWPENVRCRPFIKPRPSNNV